MVKPLVAIDTAPFIYLIEEDPRYLSQVNTLFDQLDAGKIRAVTSELTLLEVLVLPLREKDVALAERYERILSNSKNLTLVAINKAVLRLAAQLRSQYNVRTPDAIQLATAVRANAKRFITNDRRLPKTVGELVIETLA